MTLMSLPPSLLLVAGLTVSMASLVAQSTIRVPSQQPTIQAGIDAAAPGDTILIEAGTYPVTGLSTNGKQLTIRGEQGAARTVLDGGHSGRILSIDSFEGPNLVIEGLTFFRGNAAGGGALRIATNAEPTIRDCIFDRNFGGIGSSIAIEENATATILRTEFTDNGDPTPNAPTGSTVSIVSSKPITLTDCTFRDNLGGLSDVRFAAPSIVVERCLFEGSRGTAIFLSRGALAVRETAFRGDPSLLPNRVIHDFTQDPTTSVHVEDCVFENLTVEQHVLFSMNPVTILRTRFTGNTGFSLILTNGAGALLLEDCTFESNSFQLYIFFVGGGHDATVRRCRFMGNSTGLGTVRVDGVATLESCLFYDNTCLGQGALAIRGTGSCTVDHCTLVRNRATSTNPNANPTGGIFWQGNSLTVQSSILWDNMPAQILVSAGTPAPTVTYCDIQSGFAGTGNIDVDPGFVSSLPFDHRLSLSSPCRDAAAPGTPVPLLDLDGDPRVVGGRADMGADEIFEQPYPGTQEDLEVTTLLDGAGDPIAPVKRPNAGDLLRLELRSPNGTFVGAPFLILAQVERSGTPLGPRVLLGVDLNPFSPTAFIVLDSTQVLPQFGGFLLPATGFALEASVPPGANGLSLYLQGVALTASAANGFYAVSNAHEIVLP